MGEMAARDDLEGQGEGIMDEERDTGMAAMSRKDRREHTSGHIRRRQALSVSYTHLTLPTKLEV